MIEVNNLVFHLHIEDIIVSNAFSASRNAQAIKFVNHACSVNLFLIQSIFYSVFSAVITKLMYPPAEFGIPLWWSGFSKLRVGPTKHSLRRTADLRGGYPDSAYGP